MPVGRAHFWAYLIGRDEGDILDGATCTLYDQGTTTPISAIIYANDTDGTTLTNPLTASATGKVEFYLAAPARLSMKVEKSGHTDTTDVIDVMFSGTGSAHIIREGAVAETVRGALMFTDADFDITDDAVDNELVIVIAAALARLAGTNTWTNKQSFAVGGAKGAAVGDVGRWVQVTSGASTYYTRNAEYDGTNWIRLFADNDASVLELNAGGDLQYLTQSDGLSTVGSIITLVVRFAINKSGLITVEGWTAPTLLNDWVNFGGGNAEAGYWKDPFGVVHLRGTIKDGSGLPTLVFTLPAGSRPSASHRFATVSNGLFGIATVDSSGGVSASSGSTTYFSLDGITFKAEA